MRAAPRPTAHTRKLTRADPGRVFPVAHARTCCTHAYRTEQAQQLAHGPNPQHPSLAIIVHARTHARTDPPPPHTLMYTPRYTCTSIMGRLSGAVPPYTSIQ